MTEGEEDLQFLFQEELESSKDDAFSWEGADSSEEIGSSSSDDTAAGGNPHQFLKAPRREAKREAAAAAGEAATAPGTTAATAATTTMMMMMTTTVETHRREAQSAVGIQTPTTGRCRQYRRSRIKSRRIDSFVKSAFLVMNFPFNEIEFPQFRVFIYLPKKPMATHQASINIQEPTKFKLEATRRRIILPA